MEVRGTYPVARQLTVTQGPRVALIRGWEGFVRAENGEKAS